MNLMKHCLLPVSQSVNGGQERMTLPDAIDASGGCASAHATLSRKSGERGLDQEEQF